MVAHVVHHVYLGLFGQVAAKESFFQLHMLALQDIAFRGLHEGEAVNYHQTITINSLFWAWLCPSVKHKKKLQGVQLWAFNLGTTMH